MTNVTKARICLAPLDQTISKPNTNVVYGKRIYDLNSVVSGQVSQSDTEGFLQKLHVQAKIESEVQISAYWILVISRNAPASTYSSASGFGNVDSKISALFGSTLGSYQYFILSGPRICKRSDQNAGGTSYYNLDFKVSLKKESRKMFRSNNNYLSLMLFFEDSVSTETGVQVATVGEVDVRLQDNQSPQGALL